MSNNGIGQEFQRTPLLKCPDKVFGRTLWIKDESACPTGTFKDRLGWALARQIERKPVTNLLITCITLGNTLRSVAHYLSMLPSKTARPQLLGFFPLGFSNRRIGPDIQGRVISGDDVIRWCRENGALAAEADLESAYLDESNIMRLAQNIAPPFDTLRDISYGVGEAAYAPILEEALKELPDMPTAVLVPVGAGVLFDECVDVVEAQSLTTTVIGVSVLSPKSVADKIYGFYSSYFEQLNRKNVAVHARYPRHKVIAVKENEILKALRWASQYGYKAEPSAAAGLVPLIAQAERFSRGSVLWINTGNGVLFK